MKLQFIAPVGMLLGGTILTIASSYQNKQIIDGMKYFHPFIQTFCYFLGESICYLLFLYNFKQQSKESKQLKQEIMTQSNESGLQKRELLPLYGLFPAVLDGIAMTLQYSSLTLISPSVYQILRGGVILITAILSVTLLKRKLNILNIIGLLVVLIGIVIVGASNLAFGLTKQGDNHADNNDQVIAYLLILVSLFANAMLFIQEEKIIKSQTNLKPFDLVGIEGVWGLIFYSVFLLILHFVSCSGKFCVYENSTSVYGTIESIPVFFDQLSSNSSLIISQVIVFFTIGFYALSAVTVTRNISAMVRSLIDVSRCLFVWIVGIMITINSEEKWESTDPIGIVIQTIGFLFIVVGSLIYNQILFRNSTQIYFYEVQQYKFMQFDNKGFKIRDDKKEFNLTLLDISEQLSSESHEGYHKLSEHQKKHSHNKHNKNENQSNLMNSNISTSAAEDEEELEDDNV